MWAVVAASGYKQAMESSDIRTEFLSAMAGALSRYGETTDGIEGPLRECARRLGVEASFFAVPTAVFASYRHNFEEQTVLVRTMDSGIDLHTLDLLDKTLSDVTHRRKSAAQGLAEVRLITSSPLRFPWYMRVLASGLGAAAFSVFLGGGAREIVAAVPVGLTVGLLATWARRNQSRSALLELVAGFLAAVLTLSLGHVLPHFHLATVVLAGLILLLPGLTLTLGVSELASRHLVAGSARLAGAVIALTSLGFGVAVGYAVFTKFGWVPPLGPGRDAAGHLLTAVAVIASSLALMVTTNSRPRDIAVIIAAVAVAAYGARFGAWLIGPTVGVILAAVLLGLASNAWARLTSRPAAIPLVPGLAALVPGALGFRGISAFLREATGSLQILGVVLVIAGGLVVGLLVADAALPSRRPLKNQ
ncbi:MAG TPA: threonine/serine exporter family protein [Thermoleophilia bacterium]|nr:threonine/serine exporter family protein [Thermoleophilia bacterium]